MYDTYDTQTIPFVVSFEAQYHIPQIAIRNLLILFGDIQNLIEECIHNTLVIMQDGRSSDIKTSFRYNSDHYMIESLSCMLDAAESDDDFNGSALAGIVDDIDVMMYGRYLSLIAYDVLHGILIPLIDIVDIENSYFEVLSVEDRTNNGRNPLTEHTTVTLHVGAITETEDYDVYTERASPLIRRGSHWLGRRRLPRLGEVGRR